MTRVPRSALAGLALSALGAATIALVVWPRLFDSTPPGVARLVAARCAGALERECSVRTLALSSGRHWLEASAPEAEGIVLDFEPGGGEPAAQALLLGARVADLGVSVERAAGGSGYVPVAAASTSGGPRRSVVQLRGIGSADRVRVRLERVHASGEQAERLRVEEVGLFASEAGLGRDARWFLRGVPDRQLYNGLLARACVWLAAFGTVAAFFSWGRDAAWARAAFVLFLTLAVTSLELFVVYTPYWDLARDLRVVLASGPVQEGVGSNLNYGMHLGSRFLRGEGITFGPGWVPWERMPGYGFFGALAGLLAGYKTDIFTIGLVSIELHLAFFAIANVAFVTAAARVMHPGLAVAASVLVIFMPNQLMNTQADSIMVAVYLLTAGALCLYLYRERAGGVVPLACHLWIHLSFALWFLMRPEGVVGWGALSLLLYWRSPRRLALPAALYLAIGLSWALYKRQYTGEFSMTTNTIGDNAWISLWQAPNKFRWQTMDASYFEFEAHLDAKPRSKRASDLALREVARFALTYPVYVAHVALHKFVQFVDGNAVNGLVAFPRLEYETLRGPGVWLLMGLVALSLVLPREARRTLFLAWPLFFNLPLFLFFFSDGMRHVAPVTACLFVATLPLLGESAFYRTLWERRGRALCVVSGSAAVWFLLHWADRALLASDRWRYWTPFLDPAPFAWYLR
jgi:hypothetical protein